MDSHEKKPKKKSVFSRETRVISDQEKIPTKEPENIASLAEEIVMAWIITIPASALILASVYLPIIWIK